MPYTLDKNGVTPSVPLTASEQDNLNTFMNRIRLEGVHPITAAASWDSDYKNLIGNQYQIRLSQRNRVTFEIDGDIVRILQVGGHT